MDGRNGENPEKEISLDILFKKKDSVLIIFSMRNVLGFSGDLH